MGRVDTPANVGTYLDAPFHRFREREDLSQLPLGLLVRNKGVVIDVTEERSRAPVPNSLPAVFLGRRGVDPYGLGFTMGTDAYWEPGPYLLEDFAHELVEHLCHLDQLPLSGFRFSAPFLRIQGGASFPVRAFAELGQR